MAALPGAAFLGQSRARLMVVRSVVLTALLSLTVACSAIYRNHGYVPDDAELSALVIGKDTQETVATKVGPPSVQGLLNEQGWFYVQSRFKHFGPAEPAEVSREVVVLNFTSAGVLSNIGRYGLEDGRVIEFSRRVTDSNIKGVTFIGQLLGNVGRLQAADYLGADR